MEIGFSNPCEWTIHQKVLLLKKQVGKKNKNKIISNGVFG